MNPIRVAGAQIPVTKDIPHNVETLLRAIRYAAEHKADILLTPEGSLSGYTHEFDTDAARQGLEQVTAAARQQRVGLALGTCFYEADGRCYNQVRFYLPDGAYLGFHSKILRCGTLEIPPQGEINHYATSALKTFKYLGVRAGALICNDLWANPGCTPVPDSHLVQRLARRGAGIIFHAVYGGRDGSEWSRLGWQYHESNLRMRAQASKVYIVTVDCCTPETIPCSAPSGVIDPNGNWVCQAKTQGEDFYVITLP
jgi:predicted amidohydrolase